MRGVDVNGGWRSDSWWPRRTVFCAATGGLALALSAAMVTPVTAGGAELSSARPETTVRAAAGKAKVVRETRIDDRTTDLLIYSPALGTTAPVRLLLPEGWSPGSGRRWPVLYLLHGCCETADYEAWTKFTDVEDFVADKNVLTVIPTGGPSGFYTRWWNYDQAGGPDWEAFHLDELRGILERDYAAGDKRAVAGLSIGGYGALAYAYRRPGMFGAAASYSGLLNTLQPGVPGVIGGIMVRTGEDPRRLWGDRVFNSRVWSEHNPFDHAGELRGMALYVSCGNGLPGPLDPVGRVPDPLEPSALSTSQVFTARLRELGIPVTTDYYGNGTHTWPYWERQLQQSWPVLATGLGVPT